MTLHALAVKDAAGMKRKKEREGEREREKERGVVRSMALIS